MTNKILRTLAAVGALLAAGLAAAQQAPQALFGEPRALPDVAIAAQRDRQVAKARPVAIDTALLTAPMAAIEKVPAPKQAIALNLFDDAQYVADLERIERTANGMAWIGTLRDVDKSQVVIVVAGTVVAGNIVSPQGRYHIRPIGEGLHEVQAIDVSLFGEDEPFVPLPSAAQAALPVPDQAVGVQPDDGTQIDVMVVYTATTRAAAGGTANMLSLIDLAIAETNQSYQNSGVTQRVRLVHSVEVAYTEAATDPLGAGLNCITATADGCLDNIHTLRDTYRADLVSFWLENGGGYCGLAWLMSSVSSGFAVNGFSTVDRECATGYYSFGHELGHNMGARHDTYVDTATTPYAYAHGYTDPNATSPWRTVMAYNNACVDAGKNCTRIPYWSNPSVLYGGRVMGNASTADNHRTLNNTAYTVANFRTAVVSTTGFPPGGTMPAGWVQAPGSLTNWAVATDYAYDGSYSLKSINPGTAPSGQYVTSAIQVTGRYQAGTVSFVRRVDSESGFDFLRFYIDGVKQGEWSGQLLSWQYESYPVSRGTHTFKWEYGKDYVVSTGADAAWIDAVQLPAAIQVIDLTPILMQIIED